jgi:uncharacterized protein YfaS (alpha-2-macroglobulin family)
MGIDAFLKVAPKPGTGEFSVKEKLADKSLRDLALAGERSFKTSFTDEAKALRFENREANNLFFQVTVAGFDRESPKKEIFNGIEIMREFTDSSGKKLASISMGDEVWVSLSFRALGKDPIGDVALVDLLPSGLEPDIDSIRRGEGRTGVTPDYVDIREDRIVAFVTMTPNRSVWRYKTRAITSGQFIVPPLFAEAMYDKPVWAMTQSSSLAITREP